MVSLAFASRHVNYTIHDTCSSVLRMSLHRGSSTHSTSNLECCPTGEIVCDAHDVFVGTGTGGDDRLYVIDLAYGGGE